MKTSLSHTIKHRKKISLIAGVTLALYGASLSTIASAATLHIIKHDQSGVDDKKVTVVQVRVDTKDAKVQGIEGGIKTNIKNSRITHTNDTVPLWLEQPQLAVGSPGGVVFSGVIPGGVAGDFPLFTIVAAPAEADPVVSIGPLTLISYNQNENGSTTQILIPETTVRLQKNDGPDVYREPVVVDEIPPEAFKPELQKSPDAAHGMWLLSFFATDKQSGIDYYQVREGDTEWQTTTSPYQIKDQSFKSFLAVKAVDRAGNIRIIEITAQQKENAMKSSSRAALIHKNILFGIVILIVLWILQKIVRIVWRKK